MDVDTPHRIHARTRETYSPKKPEWEREKVTRQRRKDGLKERVLDQTERKMEGSLV